LFEETLRERGIFPDLVLLGEPTDLGLNVGSRGRIETEVTTTGQAGHSCAPRRGLNALEEMVPVVADLQQSVGALPSDRLLGPASMTFTNMQCAPGVHNVLPNACVLTVDRRYLPSEEPDQIVAAVEERLGQLSAAHGGLQASVNMAQTEARAYAGLVQEVRKHIKAWCADTDDPLVEKARSALKAVGLDPQFGRWEHSTDGGYTQGELGIPTIGFGPGDEALSHTSVEHVPFEAIKSSVLGTASVVQAIAGYPTYGWAPDEI
jgi:acetylornithine deacetylase/succinyl-diaminopimelate desuccinylase-like protein